MRRGAVAMEFALVLPVLMVLLIGTLEWGLMLVREVALVQIARDGALAGALTREVDDPEAVATDRVQAALDYAGFNAGTAIVTITRVPLSSGEALEVSVTLPYGAVFSLVPTPTTLHAVTVMRMEDQ